MKDKSYFDLIDLVERQGHIIKNQSKVIGKLISENIEKENLINELMSAE